MANKTKVKGRPKKVVDFEEKAKYIYLDADKAWDIIERGLSNDLLYPEHMLIDDGFVKNEDWVKAMMTPGEEYTLIPHCEDDYLITSKGRVLNSKLKNVLRIYVNVDSMSTYIRYGTVQIKDLMEDVGYTFNYDEILDRYRTNKWKHIINAKTVKRRLAL